MLLPITDPKALPTAIAAIQRGELIVLPTDTVYGVACSPFNAAAIERLYVAKQRPQEKAIQVLLASTEDALQVAESIPPLARLLAKRFWPGALTFTLPKRPDLPPNLSVYETVGVRVPDHEGCRAVIRAAGGVLAATSANRSGAANPTRIEDANTALGDAVSVYLDGGPTPGDMASTVIRLEDDGFTILRQGPVTEAMLKAALAEHNA